MATLWQQRVREALRELELTHAQFVLLASVAWLAREGRAVTQAQIAEHAKTDAVMTSEVLRTLERRRLVRRLTHPDDARAKRVEPTSAGRALAERAIPKVEAVDEAFFSEAGPELRALARALSHLGA